jgi:hypothetical protein
MIDVSVSYRRYRFLGGEFLTWLWFRIEFGEIFEGQDLGEDLQVGNKIVFEKVTTNENITIKGNETGFTEGKLALNKGAYVTEIALVFKMMEYEWKFIIKGESFNYSSFKAPATDSLKKKDEFEGTVLEKHYLNKRAIEFIERSFKAFLKLRLSDNWGEEVTEISHWMRKV